MILSKLNKILDHLSHLSSNHNIADYVEKFKKNSKKVSDRGLNEIEISKCKVELTKKYYEIGKYISEKYYNKNVLDFSYDEEYILLNEKIVKLKQYIEKISRSK